MGRNMRWRKNELVKMIMRQAYERARCGDPKGINFNVCACVDFGERKESMLRPANRFCKTPFI